MTTMKLRAILAFAVTIAVTGIAFGQPKAKIEDLHWMAGCWESNSQDKMVLLSEQWMKPAGGMMIGAGRTVKSAKAVDWEFMRIEQSGETLTFFAKPRDNSGETPF